MIGKIIGKVTIGYGVTTYGIGLIGLYNHKLLTGHLFSGLFRGAECSVGCSCGYFYAMFIISPVIVPCYLYGRYVQGLDLDVEV